MLATLHREDERALDVFNQEEAFALRPDQIRELSLKDIAPALRHVLRYTVDSYPSMECYLLEVLSGIESSATWIEVAEIPLRDPPRYEEPVLAPTTKDEAAALADGLHGFMLGNRSSHNPFDDLWAWARAAAMEEAQREGERDWSLVARRTAHVAAAFSLLHSWLRP